jgi:diguanylate cyclase (GGDEF)-like protein
MRYCDYNYFAYAKFLEKLGNFYHYLSLVYNKKRLYREYLKYANEYTRIINKRELLEARHNHQMEEDVFKIVALTAFHANDQEAAYQEILKCIKSLNFAYVGFYYLDEPFDLEDCVPHDLYLKAEIKDNNVSLYDFEECEAVSILEKLDDAPHTCVFCALYAGYQILGYVLMECRVDQTDLACLTAKNLGLATKYLNLFSISQKRLQFIEQFNEALQYEADYDELTGLLNRRGFIRKSYELYNVYEGMHAYLYYIDLDRLKVINDSYGHLEGDFAINKVAEVLRANFRETDLVARIGGDEFAALAIMPHRDEDVNGIKIRKAFEEFNKTKAKPYEISASTGYVEFTIEKGLRMENLFESADALLYKAKEINHK